MNTKCLIIDDEPLAIALIEDHVSKFSNLEIVASCQNAIEGFEVLKSQQIDLIFLDIQMPMLTGIEFLKSLGNPPKVIFTTAYREYAIESYELEVVDYLLKPISFDRFFKAINKYLKAVEPKNITATVESRLDDCSRYIYVNMNKKHYKILFADILYVESIKDYVRIHTLDAKFITKEKISDFENKLPSFFLRTHRSYIVNTYKITAFTSQDIEFGDIEIPIGISYKQGVLEVLKQN
ncbi:LytR/AlgR family response regulator transcription factor [Xanthovirga aplysinae]|uniref:LytR/AlgR family response regulator transcription factor n=1 Tax=Xanthovirga aplysinae TaxID=2529853 RepID=UPI0012BC4E94|nr:LytTR family DNA-binding domain-containing protein [Xanthovirga aplysinae]MTI29432.1 response regulator transcription factor [Xanthovirga aplysinae]